MRLHMVKRTHGFCLDKILIDVHAIERAESMVKKEGQTITNRGFQHFEWAPGVPVSDFKTVEEECQLIAISTEEASEEEKFQPEEQ